jgi:hypothetical protein
MALADDFGVTPCPPGKTVRRVWTVWTVSKTLEAPR